MRTYFHLICSKAVAAGYYVSNLDRWRSIQSAECDAKRFGRDANDFVDIATMRLSANTLRCVTEGHEGEERHTPRARSRYDAGLPAMRSRGRHCRSRRCRKSGHHVSRHHEARPADALLAGVHATTGRRHGGGRAVYRRVLGSHRAVYPPWGGQITPCRAAAEPHEEPTTQAHGRLEEANRAYVKRYRASRNACPRKGPKPMRPQPIPETNSAPADARSWNTKPSLLAHRWQLRYMATTASRPVDHPCRQARRN